jgi:putative DNA primase/helicase
VEKAVSLAQAFYTPDYHTSANDDFAPTSPLATLQPDTNERYTWTDIGAGRLFADYFRSKARYVSERKVWYVYQNGIWSSDTGSIQTMELCKQLADQLMLYALRIQDERQRNAYIDYCRKWQQRRYRETILKDAQGVYPITMAEFDRDPYLFNCQNGTLHLNTLEFTPHRAEDHLTKQSPVTYDPAAHSDRFLTFVEQIMSGDAEKSCFLQKAMGYGLSGDTRYECLFILFGATTRNGKGTLCESVLQVLGSYGCTSRPETIAIRNTSGGGNPTEDIARLAGVRFANISEPYKGLVLNASQVKSMTGNDTLNARFLHENSFDFRPQFKLYINTNYLPTVTDMTLFSSGRIVIIPFDRHFDEVEQDKSLKQAFAKPKCQSAILNWLVHGYQMLYKEGLSQPKSVQEALSLYRHESDKIAQFMADELVETPDGEERTSAVYSRYRSWCVDNGHHSENMRNFKQALSAVATVVRRRPKTGGGETTLLTGYTLTSEFL